MHCSNNLKQIGLAMHEYHTTYRSLPWGAKGGWGHSWTTDILPQLEQGGMWESSPKGEQGWVTASSFEGTQFREMAHFSVPTYRCPSQPGRSHTVEDLGQLISRAICSYTGNAGSDVDRDNYSSAGRTGMERGNGVLRVGDFISDRDAPPNPPAIRFPDIFDGLSQTLLVLRDPIASQVRVR